MKQGDIKALKKFIFENFYIFTRLLNIRNECYLLKYNNFIP